MGLARLLHRQQDEKSRPHHHTDDSVTGRGPGCEAFGWHSCRHRLSRRPSITARHGAGRPDQASSKTCHSVARLGFPWVVAMAGRCRPGWCDLRDGELTEVVRGMAGDLVNPVTEGRPEEKTAGRILNERRDDAGRPGTVGGLAVHGLLGDQVFPGGLVGALTIVAEHEEGSAIKVRPAPVCTTPASPVRTCLPSATARRCAAMVGRRTKRSRPAELAGPPCERREGRGIRTRQGRSGQSPVPPQRSLRTADEGAHLGLGRWGQRLGQRSGASFQRRGRCPDAPPVAHRLIPKTRRPRGRWLTGT